MNDSNIGVHSFILHLKVFLKISQFSSQRNLSQDDGELIALNHQLFYQNFFPLLHYVPSGSLSPRPALALNQSEPCSKCGEWLSRWWPHNWGGMTGSITALCSHYPDCSPLCSLVSDNQQPGLGAWGQSRCSWRVISPAARTETDE